MNDVVIPALIYPCWAFALERVGKKDLFSLKWLEKDMPKLLIEYSTGFDYIPKSEDILVWKNMDKNASEKFYAPVNLSDGNIVSEAIQYECSVGVYEGNGLVSDMVAIDGNTIPFVIRMRKLAQLSQPDFYIRFY